MANLPDGDPRHGRQVGYKAGCRCGDCRDYQRESNKRSAVNRKINRKIKRIRRNADFASPYGNGSSTDY